MDGVITPVCIAIKELAEMTVTITQGLWALQSGNNRGHVSNDRFGKSGGKPEANLRR